MVRAYAWVNIAAASGQSKAVDGKKQMESKLSSADRARGQALSAKLLNQSDQL
jgi:hypothetical protein